jgi:nucleoside-diphosphate-sugar epimerase|tara:strand:- start:7453 stop:8166 length:714 start_codon:yes stop_codon:yes gene_type:complete
MKSNCIYGSGMLARAFFDAQLPNNVVVIAAGVSDSQETDASNFMRESAMLQRVILENQGKKIVYFSSCSIYQKNKTPYIKHKLAMEQVIKKLADHYQIFRLPQIVGYTNNNTTVNYFVKSIVRRDIITIQCKAARCLIDVSDVVRIVITVISNTSFQNNTIDISNGINTPIHSIVSSIGKSLSINPVTKLSNSGENYVIPSLKLGSILSSDDPIYKSGYIVALLEKYVPILASQHHV